MNANRVREMQTKDLRCGMIKNFSTLRRMTKLHCAFTHNFTIEENFTRTATLSIACNFAISYTKKPYFSYYTIFFAFFQVLNARFLCKISW